MADENNRNDVSADGKDNAQTNKKSVKITFGRKNKNNDSDFAERIGSAGRKLTPLLVVVAVILCISMFCTTTIPSGHTGVVTSFGKVQDYTLDSGLHFKLPWYNVIKMDNRVQKQSLELSCFSSDIQEVNVVYTVNFRIEKENAMKIYSNIGKDYYETVITPAVAESVKTVTAKYTAENLISMRTELAQAIEVDLGEKLAVYNVEVMSTSVEDMDFTDAFTDAVEQKQVAQQNKLRAETEAEQKIIEAEAEAKVKLIEAEAEAEANKKISESLTDRILNKMLYEKWDGVMPKITGSGEFILPSDIID